MARTAAQALAANIRARRARVDRSQADLAEAMRRLGHRWNRATVAAIEGGSRAVSVEELLGLALVFGVQIGELLDAGEEDLDYGGLEPMPAVVARQWVRSAPAVQWDGRQLILRAIPTTFVDYLRWAIEEGRTTTLGDYAIEPIGGIQELVRRRDTDHAPPPTVEPKEGDLER
jgi:transcriptional regulator with XRE-family HTH domain